MRPGTRIGVDVGTVRVGVAGSDPEGILASPIETLSRDMVTESDQEWIADLARRRDAVEVVVGVPVTLAGAQGSAARSAYAYAVGIARRVAPVPVRVVDERLSTVTAHQRLRDAGVGGRRRRPVIDQAAAVEILQHALDAERASGRPPGTIVVPGPEPDPPAPEDQATEARPQ